MLAGDFYIYNIESYSENEIVARITINKDHGIFKGHFPQVPVVPGVCQLQIIKEILSIQKQLDVQLSNAREIKFLSLINPEVTPELILKINYEHSETDSIKVTASFIKEETQFLKFKGEYIKKKKSFKHTVTNEECCIIIPTYNNSQTIKDVIEGVKKYSSYVFVVNDGSKDETAEILNKIEGIKVLTHKKNKGKGRALKTGFEEAIKSGFKYAITIDSDGQHYPKDIPLFYEKINEIPNSIIIGTRKLKQENMPGKNTFANKFSNFWFRLQTGKNLQDTQSGFRLYPLLKLEKMRFFSVKYEFELEVIVRASWKNIKIISIPIDVYYPPKEERITHFRPFRDFARISILNTVLTFLALSYFRPAIFLKKLFSNTDKTK